MKQDIASLQTQLQETRGGLDTQGAQLTESLQKANAQVKEVSDSLAEINRSARNTDADFGVQLDQLRAELQDLRGQIELTDYRVGQMQASMQSASAAAATNAAANTATPADVSKPPVQAPKDKKGMLAFAADTAAKQQYSDARGVYREVLKQWPNDAGVADLAHMRIGDTFYDEKRFRDALPEYIKVVEKFGKGEYADDAYFKIGQVSVEPRQPRGRADVLRRSGKELQEIAARAAGAGEDRRSAEASRQREGFQGQEEVAVATAVPQGAALIAGAAASSAR